jgi:putative endonuclease
MRQYYVYILASAARVLYTGVTNDLSRRLVEHRDANMPKFTSRYRVTRLVFFETFSDIHQAIEAEKRIKGWSRAKKLALVEAQNPDWKDLSLDFTE